VEQITWAKKLHERVMTHKPTPDADRLRRVNALLEVALSLPDHEREPWLRTLPPHQQPLVPLLVALLARAAVETDDFLRNPVNAFVADMAHADLTSLKPGGEIGPYRLIRELGAGGMATVWLAERSDGLLRRQVALKLPHEGWGPGFAQRMAAERDILASLEHPGIARLYDAGVTATGKPWMAMEYVSGSPIDVYCTSRQLDLRQRLQLFLQVIDAVAHAHARLIVHRDLKPSNILVTADAQARLLDFGVAKLLADESSGAANVTQMMGRPVTPEYASPEQLGGHAIGVATDVYSLGVVLYELLTGARPYKLARQSLPAMEKAILSADVPAASIQVPNNPKLSRQLQGDLDTILAKTLKKEVRDRYSSVEALGADLKRHLDGEPVLARADGGWYRAKKFLRRYALPVSAAASVMAALLIGLGAATWQAREAMLQNQIARAKQAQSQASSDFTLMVLTEGMHADEALTLDQLVTRSEAIAERDFSANPTERAVAADTVADWLMSNDQYERALQLLNRTLERLPSRIDTGLARTLRCQRAAARVGLGQMTPGISELDQVIASSIHDPEAAWYCLQRRTTAALQLSDALGAARFSEEALRQFERSGNTSSLRHAHLVADQAYAAMLNGRPAKADSLFRESVALLEQAGRADSNLAVSVYNDWAIALWNSGNPQAALKELDRGIEITVSRSPSREELATSYGNRAHTLRALGRLDEAFSSFERMQRLAHESKNPSYEAYALAGQAVVAVELGRLDQARQSLQSGLELQRNAALTPAGAPSMWLRAAQAAVWQAEGKLREADDMLSDIQTQNAKQQTKTGAVAETAIRRAEIAIAQRRFDEATLQAKQALDIARQAQGDQPHSFLTGKAYLALAKSYQGSGALEAARDASRQASENLSLMLGATHPLSVEAQMLTKALKA
jgi:tetratricopeptide (TPR) repeat protein